jgi:hypothetical protein
VVFADAMVGTGSLKKIKLTLMVLEELKPGKKN